jgi:pimeloyl-ACP methyl ester carboxylesterase
MLVKINNENINIRTGGYQIDLDNNPTMLLIHGAGMDATVWQMQTRYLANKGINILAVDLPAHGLSEGKELSTISEMSDWVIELTKTLKIKFFSIAGHSMGSLIALETMKKDSKNINKSILLGTASLMPVHPDLIIAAEDNLPLAANLITDWSFGTKQHLGNHPLPGYWMIDSSIQLIKKSKKGILAKDLIACNEYKDALTIAKNIKQEVIIIAGKQDKMTPIKKASELKNVISNSEIFILESTGHMMMIENPIKVTQILYNLFK